MRTQKIKCRIMKKVSRKVEVADMILWMNLKV